MTPRVAALVCVLYLLAAFVLDMVLARRIEFLGVRPDLTMAALVPLALTVRRKGGAFLGLLAGALQGSCVSLYLGSFAVSRALAGWTVGLLEQRLFRDSLIVAAAAGLIGSLTADGAFYLFAPQPQSGLYWLVALGRAGWTALFVIPNALLVRRLLPLTPQPAYGP